jgi:hypothetical protein
VAHKSLSPKFLFLIFFVLQITYLKEYPGANNKEDDVAVIGAKLVCR